MHDMPAASCTCHDPVYSSPSQKLPSTAWRRYGRNWIKVRALGLQQYHSVLLVDADVAVLGSLAPLFAMPAEFAAVWDQSRWLNRCGCCRECFSNGQRGHASWRHSEKDGGAGGGAADELANIMPCIAGTAPRLKRSTAACSCCAPAPRWSSTWWRCWRSSPSCASSMALQSRRSLGGAWRVGKLQHRLPWRRCRAVFAACCWRWQGADPPCCYSHSRPCRYYRYTGATLPLQWNCMTDDCLEGNYTGGLAAAAGAHGWSCLSPLLAIVHWGAALTAATACSSACSGWHGTADPALHQGEALPWAAAWWVGAPIFVLAGRPAPPLANGGAGAATGAAACCGLRLAEQGGGGGAAAAAAAGVTASGGQGSRVMRGDAINRSAAPTCTIFLPLAPCQVLYTVVPICFRFFPIQQALLFMFCLQCIMFLPCNASRLKQSLLTQR